MRKSAPVRFGCIKARPPLCFAGQRIGLIGGSFNPLHDGHKLIVNTALRRLRLDQVWVLVSPGNPLKSRRGLPSTASRTSDSHRALDNPKARVSDLEAYLPTPYTAATLAYLKARCPGVRFVWIMGADSLAGIHRWRHWRDVMGAMPVAVVDRPGWHLRALASPAARAFATARRPEQHSSRLPGAKAPAWTLLTGPLHPASSTAIRGAKKRQPEPQIRRRRPKPQQDAVPVH